MYLLPRLTSFGRIETRPYSRIVHLLSRVTSLVILRHAHIIFGGEAQIYGEYKTKLRDC